MPLKIITCLYCNKTLNEKVYEYFKNLYLNNNLFTENNEIQYSNQNNLKEKKSRNKKNNNVHLNKNNTYSSFINHKKDELLNFSSFNNSYYSNVSFAEVLKKKKSNLFLNFEKRKNKKSKIYSSSTNIEMNNIYKRFHKHEKIENIKINKKYNSSKNLIKEPSKKLLKRLINGEKIKMTKKEIKEVNERLYKKLNEVKQFEKEKERKEEIKKLNFFKKSYTTNLKNKVIQKYKENFNKNNILNNLNNNNNENNILNNEQNNIDSIKLINIGNHKK